MNVIIPPIQSLVEVHSSRLLLSSTIILQESMPILVTTVHPRHDLILIQEEPLLTLGLRHRPMHEGLVRGQDVILRQSVSLLNLPEVLVGGVGSEVMGAFWTGLETKPSEVVEIGLSDGLQGLHEV